MLIFMDIETVPDRERFERGEGQSLEAWREAKREAGELNPFVPWPYHRPVSLATIRVYREAVEVAILSDSESGASIAAQWWRGWEHHRSRHGAVLVTWGGRWFDLPVLEAAAVSEGIGLGGWLVPPTTKPWDDPRGRGGGVHVDLCDWTANAGAAQRISQAAAAAVCNVPGKITGISGGDVEDAWSRGEREAVHGYCACDVLTLLEIYRLWVTAARIVDNAASLACEAFSRISPGVGLAIGLWIEELERLRGGA